MTRFYQWAMTVLVGAALLNGLRPDRAAASSGVWQSPVATPVPGPHVNSVEPDSLRADSGGSLTVLGSSFVEGAAVRLIGWGVLTTNFINATTLTAQVPASIKAGSYVVQVRTPDGQTSPETPQLRVNAAPGPTETPEPTSPAPFVRPLLTVASYSTNPGPVAQGKTFGLAVAIKNVADDTAFNVVLTIPSGDFVPIGNAGTQTVQKIHVGETIVFNQELQAKSGIAGGLKPLELKITYNDRAGTGYSETPTVSINVAGGGAAKPTATPVPKQPQLIISDYHISPAELSPGLEFKLFMKVQNVGTGDATRLSVVLGGAASSGSTTGGTGEGTGTGASAGAEGVSGAGGDFAVFGPIGSSNVKFYPRITLTDTLDIEQMLIVNSTAKSGAYTVKVSLVYDDPKGQRRTDDQVITLLVLSPLLVEISYSRELDPATAGQAWAAPLQVVNVGRNTTQLGKFEIVAPSSVSVQNGGTFVGQLEAGGQFPLDAQLTPNEAGPLEFTARLNYLDDFNRPQVISQTFTIEVEARSEPSIDPSQPNSPLEPALAEESLGDQILRLILGLVGLDSGRPQPATNVGPGPIGTQTPGGIQVVPVVPKG
jgi:hypothetical protein